MTLVLSSRTDLARAGRLASWLHRVPIDRVIVSLPWLDSRERERAGHSLQAYFNDCGCGQGALAFVLVLAVSLWMDPWTGASPWTAVAYSFIAALFAAVPAKLAALLWSGWRLRVLLARLARAEAR
jgi:hypothetical protein